MRILLTGGAGFIGSHIAEAYLAAGHDVQIVDNLSTGRRVNAPRAAVLHEIDVHAAELERIIASFRPEVVNHHAAQSSVKVSTGDPVHDLEVNGGGTARLAKLCVQHGVRKIIYAGSGGTAYGHPEALPVTEGAALRPVSPYGLSKIVGEQYLQLAQRVDGLAFTTLRYGNAFGPRQDPHGEAGVVAIFTGLMLNGQPCTVDGDGEQRKDYVYAGDIARANVLALEAGDGLAINIGTGHGTSVNTIFATLAKETGYTIAPRFGPPRAGDVRDFWLDCALAREVLRWEPRVTFAEGIRLTVASYRAS